MILLCPSEVSPQASTKRPPASVATAASYCGGWGSSTTAKGDAAGPPELLKGRPKTPCSTTCGSAPVQTVMKTPAGEAATTGWCCWQSKQLERWKVRPTGVGSATAPAEIRQPAARVMSTVREVLYMAS